MCKMTFCFRSLAASAVFGIAAISPAAAQVAAMPDIALVRAACSGSMAQHAACIRAIEAYASALTVAGLSPAGIDALLSELAAVLGEDTLLSPGASGGIIAAAMRAIARNVSDPERAAALVGLANAVEAGEDIPVAAIGMPVSASPN